MFQNSVSVRVDFREALSSIDRVQAGINLLSKIAEELKSDGGKAKDMMFPMSTNEPEDAPIAVFQEDGRFSVVLSRRSVVLQSFMKEPTAETMADEILKLLRKLVKDDGEIMLGGEARGVIVTASYVETVEGMDGIREFMAETEYKEIVNVSNRSGFSLSHFEDCSVKSSDGRSVTYVAIADLDNAKSGVAVNVDLLLGGVDMPTAKYREVSKEKVREFYEELNNGGLKQMLEEVHGVPKS